MYKPLKVLSERQRERKFTAKDFYWDRAVYRRTRPAHTMSAGQCQVAMLRSENN